ncbi:MAG: DsrE/DsrF/DrsH-like family protein [Anaerolineales bacterium]|nr:DsrE/DsrF/DrsH-like family protein [Anaerolineales bacterium]
MAEQENRKLSLICSKGSLDMAYPPLILANAARMTGIDVDLFFTFWGLDIITRKKIKHLNVATVGNPNMHPWFHIPTWAGSIPGMSALATAMMRKEIDKLDFPPVDEFLEMVHDAGARIFACKMSMDMMKLTEDDMVPYADGIIGAMEFMDYSKNAQVLFI